MIAALEAELEKVKAENERLKEFLSSRGPSDQDISYLEIYRNLNH